MSADNDPRSWSCASDDTSQSVSSQRNTTRGWGEPRPCDMHENSAAAAGDARPGVVVQLDDEVVEMVGALEPVARIIGVKPNRLIVMAVARVFAPAVAGTDGPQRQLRARPRAAIRPPPHPAQTKGAARCAAVAFALVRPDAAAAERHRQRQGPGHQPAPGALAGPCTHKDSIEGNFTHGLQDACSFNTECSTSRKATGPRRMSCDRACEGPGK